MKVTGKLTYGQLSVWRDVQEHRRARWHEANISAVWPLPAGVTVPAVERAVRALVARHGSLRTRYDLSDKEKPRQVRYATAGEVDLGVVADPPDGAAGVAGELAGTPFDLEADFPWRARIVVRDGRPAELAFANHHIAADGWAHGVLFRELTAELAEPGSTGGEAPSLLDLAEEQCGPLADQRNARSAQGWHRFYAEVSSPAFLEALAAGPRDHEEAEALQASVGSVAMRSAAEDLGRTLGVPVSTVLLAAYAAAVARIHRLPLVPLELMSANRFHPRTRDLVVSMNQWCPLVAEAIGDDDFATFTRRLHVASLNAYRFGSCDPDLRPRAAAMGETAYDGTVWAFNFIDTRATGQAPPALPGEQLTWARPFHTIGPRYYLRVTETGGDRWGLRYRARAATRDEVAGVLREAGELLGGARR